MSLTQTPASSAADIAASERAPISIEPECSGVTPSS